MAKHKEMYDELFGNSDPESSKVSDDDDDDDDGNDDDDNVATAGDDDDDEDDDNDDDDNAENATPVSENDKDLDNDNAAKVHVSENAAFLRDLPAFVDHSVNEAAGENAPPTNNVMEGDPVAVAAGDNTTVAPPNNDVKGEHHVAKKYGQNYPKLSMLPPKGAKCKDMRVFNLYHHHHIIQFVHVDLSSSPSRPSTNLLSNACTDTSNHYHTSRHQHRLYACHLHIPPAQEQDVKMNPHVRMRSTTLGTFSTFSMEPLLRNQNTGNKKHQHAQYTHFVQLSHHFIHMHEIFCPNICSKSPWLPKNHRCPLLHLQGGNPNAQGFFPANVTVETQTRSGTECKRRGNTSFGHFEHFHTHLHTLHINATKDPPLEEHPHAYFSDFMISKESLDTEKPTAPYST